MNDEFFSKFEEETRERLANPVQETFIERKKREYAINPDVDYPEPEYVIEIGGTPTLPKGNLIALSAKWKNGKTFLCDVLTAVFLGSERFAGCRSLFSQGKVSFYDTEQAKSDTSHIRKVIDAMTPEGRHHDYDVYCLRPLNIDRTSENSDELTRYEFISQTIAHDKPDLVIIDGIADLLYNYNDVIESQRLVNRLAALANEHNCAMVVVMHQNKGLHDKNMKGHLGTMLNQKCSDVFSVEKCGGIFVVSNTISRHQPCGDFVFKLTADGVPEDGMADRKRQMEIKRQDERAKLREQISICFEDATVALKRSDIINLFKSKLGIGTTKAYEMFNAAVKAGVLSTNDNKHYFMKPS
jgi:hypothetical protein